MRNFCCGLVLLLATGILFSCGSKNSEKKFFDVPGYFKKEITYIKTNFSTVSKTSVYNGDSSKQDFKVIDINWEKEFGLFLECDINKPVYYANMKESPGAGIDTNYHSIIYSSESYKTNIEYVEIGYMELTDHDEAVFVSVKIKKSNLINATDIKAFYSKDERYVIEGTQKIKQLGEENRFFVEGKFK